jgi:hypothetical protein
MARHEHGRSLQYEVVLRRKISSDGATILSPVPDQNMNAQLDIQPSKLDISVSSTPRSLRVGPWSGHTGSENGSVSTRRTASNLVHTPPPLPPSPSRSLSRGGGGGGGVGAIPNLGSVGQERRVWPPRSHQLNPEAKQNSPAQYVAAGKLCMCM